MFWVEKVILTLWVMNLDILSGLIFQGKGMEIAITTVEDNGAYKKIKIWFIAT